MCYGGLGGFRGDGCGCCLVGRVGVGLVDFFFFVVVVVVAVAAAAAWLCVWL